MTDRVADRVLEIVAQQLAADVVATYDALVDDLAADSLDLAELAIAIEQSFDLRLAPNCFDEVRTCGELVALVEHHLAACSPSAHLLRSRDTEEPPPWIAPRSVRSASPAFPTPGTPP